MATAHSDGLRSERDGNPFDDGGPQFGLDSRPVLKEPPLHSFELHFLLSRNGVLARGIFGFPLDGSVLTHRDETWCQAPDSGWTLLPRAMRNWLQ